MSFEQLAKAPRSLHPALDVRADFPFLGSCNDVANTHYLDSAATTQMPCAVIDSITACYQHQLAPVHRGIYPLAEQATASYSFARETVASFIASPTPEQLVFSRSCTESINMVAQGWAGPRLAPGDWVWVTAREHHSNYLPWQRVCEQTGAELRVLDWADQEFPDTRELFDARSKLIALSHVSNVLGTESPVQAICSEASHHGIATLVDGAQAVGHLGVDVAKIDCDFYAFSAHKMYGPVGIGALYAKSDRLQEMDPLLLGGGMVDSVANPRSQWADVPQRFEAGSPNYPAAMGFAAAVQYLEGMELRRVQQHVGEVCGLAAEHLGDLPGVRLLAPVRSSATLFSFVVDGVHPHDVAQVAADFGVAIRAGHHCCQPLMQQLNLSACCRASFGVYSTADDALALRDAVAHAIQIFR